MNEIQALRLIRERRRRELRQVNRTRLRRLRELSDPYLMPDAAYQGLYRLNKALTTELVEELEPHMHQAERSTSIPTKLKVLCALHFFGQGSYQKSAGSDCHLGLSQAAVSRAIEEVTEAMNSPQVLTRWVHFPQTRNERRQAIQENYQATGFPGVLGFVDGTHVAIRAPSERENLYVNRKSYHSLNAQMVCDSRLRILNCVARYPGSTHDSFIWRNPEVCREMRTVWESGERCWLLGDSGYPHQPWLQTPILDAVEGSPEENYTKLHVRARSAVERCFGVLKSRFRCLHRTLEYAPAKVGRIINACTILHNMCMGHGLPIPEEEEDNGQMPNNPPEPFIAHPRALLGEARNVRESIILRLRR
ncbi:putative nuclease HARBI1 [Ischnura elegans]|uniref:putative nuclease HARBI1 n=1 Tax=Ischnura elegans TaxID=197161 RepID=UPI001ED8B43C|nr:putative nuclease HARBI1 [Ischnura elegans]XP_046384540.1 putative nuclease HARBI1 [Ischnura elegans]